MSTRYNTGNPIESTDVRDMSDNAKNFDEFSNSCADTFTDRFGVQRKTIDGVIRSVGIPIIGNFTTGCAVTDSNQGVQEVGGSVYRWKGSLPKLVPPSSTPSGTGGISPSGDWIDVGDSSIRTEISGIDGFGLIGRATTPEIRGYSGDLRYIMCSGVSDTDRTASWFYFLDATDTTSPDNGGSILIDALGRRWKRDFQKNHTGRFWEEHGAIIERIGDRLLVGDAIKNGLDAANQPDWLTQYQLSIGRSFGATQTAQVCVQSGVGTNDRGSNVLVAAGQTLTLGDGWNSIGVFGFSVANRPTGSGNAYAGYFEGFRQAGAIGGAYGVEVDTVTYAPSGEVDPYQQAPNQVIGLQLAAGAELSPTGQFPTDAAINVRNNGATYDRGIIFGNNSLSGCDGAIGTAIAVGMAKGHGLVWYSGPNASTSSVYGVSTDPLKSNGIVLEDLSVSFVQQVNAKNVFKIEHSVTGDGVNFLVARGSGVGAPLQLLARGDDTNIDIHLVPKGTGKIWLGQWTGQSDQAINGYIVVKDAAGNQRKIATLA